MERDEAKAILELCRPGNADDAQDPIIAEALGLLETDAGLKAWFDEQQALDVRISDSYHQIEAPADMKANILAGMRLHAVQSESEGQSEGVPGEATSPVHAQRETGPSESNAAIISGKHDKMNHPPSSQAWWRNPWIGLAAVFALLFAIMVIPGNDAPSQLASSENPTLQAGVPDMIQFLAREINTIKSEQRSFAKESDQPATLQAYLASTGTPSPASLPSPVRSTPSMGCFTLDYNGIKMGMICFKEDQVMHLITARKTDCISHLSTEPSIYEIDGQAFKIWIEGDQVYILSVQGTKEKLPKFI